jgi:hypothetical protein
MDRDELEQRIRTRRPGEGGLRRGTQLDEEERTARAGGYVPFVPEPEDSMAVREEEEPLQPAANVDNASPDIDQSRHDMARDDVSTHPRAPHEPALSTAYVDESEEPYQATEYPEDDAPYGAPEDAYPYPYPSSGDGRRRGTSVLPILGFILLCVLALGVGAVLASLLGGEPGQVGQATPTPSVEASVPASVEPTAEPTAVESHQANETPEPTDGPVTFPDGALIEVQPCATQDMGFDGCNVDGSTITASTMWVWIGFDDTAADDTITLTLRSEGQTIDQQEKVLGEVLGDCESNGEPICSGYLIGAAYRDLEPGEYELIVRRNEDFADAATFAVEG